MKRSYKNTSEMFAKITHPYSQYKKCYPIHLFFFLVMFVEKNKGFARILSREALGPAEKNVIDAVNQFFNSLELSVKQILADEKKLVAPTGLCAQIVITGLEGIVARFIRNEFKENPSSYLDNYWQILERSILK